MPQVGAYSASKGALSILLESLRMELEPEGIWVTTVCPGFIKTPLTDANRFPLLAWVVTLQVLGVVAFPLVSVAFRRSADRGWLLSKSVGLLLVGVSSWYAASLRLAPFHRPSLIVIVGLLAEESVDTQ